MLTKALKLSKYPAAVRYTLTEHNMFSALPKNGRRVGTRDIAKVQGDDWDVEFPEKNVSVSMLRLMGKIDANKEPFVIRKEDRYAGHNRVEYWLEMRETSEGKRKLTPRKKKANGK